MERHGIDNYDEVVDHIGKPWAPVRDLWGTDRAAVEGQRAMMAQAGGPAKLRDPSAPRPARRTPA